MLSVRQARDGEEERNLLNNVSGLFLVKGGNKLINKSFVFVRLIHENSHKHVQKHPRTERFFKLQQTINERVSVFFFSENYFVQINKNA